MGATKFWLALAVIVLVYTIELSVLVPVVLGKEMRLHPVNILFFTLATGTMFGLLGVVLAVPAAALFQSAIDEFYFFFFSSRRRHTRSTRDWSSDVCSSD